MEGPCCDSDVLKNLVIDSSCGRQLPWGYSRRTIRKIKGENPRMSMTEKNWAFLKRDWNQWDRHFVILR